MGDSQLLSPHANRYKVVIPPSVTAYIRMQNIVCLLSVYVMRLVCLDIYAFSLLKISYQPNNPLKAQEVFPLVKTMTIQRSKRNQGGNGRILQHINYKN